MSEFIKAFERLGQTEFAQLLLATFKIMSIATVLGIMASFFIMLFVAIVIG